MKLWILLLTLVLTVQVTANAQLTHLNDGSVIIDNFQEDTVGKLPTGWYDRDGNGELINKSSSEQAKYKYAIEEENNNKFLRYNGVKAMHMNFPLVNKEGINISKTPILSWKWRVFELPKNANEDYKDRNDTAASIYVVFDFANYVFKKIPRSIRYTWSTSLPNGTHLSKFFNKQKIVVLASGKNHTGKWRTFKRNIYQDYRELFGEDPPDKPVAILILSDGDSTGSHVKADYDDIELLPTATARK